MKKGLIHLYWGDGKEKTTVSMGLALRSLGAGRKVDHDLLRRAVEEKPKCQKLVMTGRNPADWMKELADYQTEMHCREHPYHQGIPARKGVEF